MSVSVIILAAGMGSRMQSDMPKVLHNVAGASMLIHAMRSAEGINAEKTVIVTGHGAKHVAKAAVDYDETAQTVLQSEQNGTGHAVQQAAPVLHDFDGDVIVLYGDTPFVRSETLQAMLDEKAKGHGVVVLGFNAADPAKYGRLVTTDDGLLDAIVEFKDATDTQRAITFCNSGVICADAKLLFELLNEVKNDNASGEYYLTDVVGLARARNLTCAAIACDEAETMGVNSRVDLAAAEVAFQNTARREAMENGATLTAAETVWFAYDTVIGRDVIIEPNVVFGPDVTVETGATIRAFSHLEGCHVSKDAIVGPYARLRPGTELGNGVKVGNFVEIKAAIVDEGAKVNHLSYIGDAEVGSEANIGAGTITCNYDGVFKHKTKIGARSFIGSNTMLVAPVSVGDDAMTGSGSVITKDIPDEALGLGRARQDNKEGFALKLMNKLRAAKAAKTKE
ncbi:bifunctional UDP-N-acetylglucosamine diphosphorylase/glucosamine-1-phosphate N-acetyltransferase GlmU [Amylibacter sp. SFDW26]|uniref:bifunctional UDP-N-acetylglucosamine diphosphorylase/glucosamine-1-phosphate N-acetyltransferase GlmU n=1 Tax=Amylibacter sp. SFDW26 TaxID=2652722 RepID=UPI00126192DB|nr:bifunctional UDP-N-acetylglucosamine diphosphorylase/glucosamine-1-phosphate N-acetyltransferase GlmU [Amylibacter sp. SFDW26]KAB7616299.1 bifunctional UDP-N-acetylglucosamine diphosphorylase/glucosamine-1-phosphate N-acetyltransferase GlmU [Amylibacter sp. SFDW26]